MLEARVLEECNELNSEDVVTPEDARRVLNPEFVNIIETEFQDPQVLVEFVCAIDCLTEMAKEINFPHDRLLDNSDIDGMSGRVLSRIGCLLKNKSLIGVAVTPTIKAYIDEFFSYGYPRLLDRIFEKTTKNFLVFNLDGIDFQLIYYRNLGGLDAINSFRLSWPTNIASTDTPTNSVCLPFNVKRTQ